MSVQVKGSGTIGGLDEGLVVSGIVTSSTQINVGSNIKIGNAGVVTATSFVGSGANLTSLPAQVSIANAGNDRIVTSSGGTNLNCESALQFDGTNLFMASELRHLGDPDTSISFPSDDTIDLAVAGNSRMRITSGGKVGFHMGSPVTRFQVGSHTFSGGHGMYNDDRVGMANHGSLTGLMLASTYNDANHPEYGVVFVQGPTTSSYNVWSISPDGPAKGNSLNLHYGAQDTNIHSPSKRKFEFDGDGDFNIIDGNVKVASGHGIDFSATANAGSPSSASSEVFDDYEEGSWTPGLSGSSSVTGQTYSSRSGYYTKIGNRVFCDFSIVIGTKGSYGGTYLQIVNLPFTINGGAYTRSCSTPIYFRTLNYRWCFLGLQQYEGQSKAFIFGVEGPGSGTDGASNRSYPNGGDIANGTELTCSFSYLAA